MFEGRLDRETGVRDDGIGYMGVQIWPIRITGSWVYLTGSWREATPCLDDILVLILERVSNVGMSSSF